MKNLGTIKVKRNPSIGLDGADWEKLATLAKGCLPERVFVLSVRRVEGNLWEIGTSYDDGSFFVPLRRFGSLREAMGWAVDSFEGKPVINDDWDDEALQVMYFMGSLSDEEISDLPDEGVEWYCDVDDGPRSSRELTWLKERVEGHFDEFQLWFNPDIRSALLYGIPRGHIRPESGEGPFLALEFGFDKGRWFVRREEWHSTGQIAGLDLGHGVLQRRMGTPITEVERRFDAVWFQPPPES